MVKVQNFNEKLEKDLSRLNQEVQIQKERSGSENLSEREILKKSVQSLSAAVYSESAVPNGAKEEKNNKLPNYIQEDADPSIKLEVERLVQLVFKSGLEKAINEVKKHPPFVEDAFHDVLIDKLLPELKKRGMLK